MKPLISTTAILAACAAPALAATDSADMGRSVGGLCHQGYAEIDSDGDGKLTRNEVEKETRAAFPKLDADGNGAVSQEEFVACLNQSAGETARAADRGPENMITYDTDGDGTISREEFMNAGTAALQQVQAGDADAAADLGRLVYLSETELEPDFGTWGPDEFAVRNHILFMSLDTDRSDDLSEVEWSVRDPSRIDMAEHLKTQFQRIDVDKSGDLSVQEMTKMRQQAAENANRSAENAADGAHPPVVYYRYDSTM